MVANKVQEMINPYNYLFMRLYKITTTVTKKNADESALLYFVIFIFFYTSPVLLIIINFFIGKPTFEIWLLIVACYTIAIYKFNKYYFFRNGVLDRTLKEGQLIA